LKTNLLSAGRGEKSGKKKRKDLVKNAPHGKRPENNEALHSGVMVRERSPEGERGGERGGGGGSVAKKKRLGKKDDKKSRGQLRQQRKTRAPPKKKESEKRSDAIQTTKEKTSVSKSKGGRCDNVRRGVPIITGESLCTHFG